MATPLPPEFEPGTVQKKPARAIGGWLILAVAILAGLGAAYLAVHTLRSREEAALAELRASQKNSTIKAVVPVQDIAPGTILDLSMVAARSIPADTAPSDVITPETFDQYAGHRVNVPLLQGRPILASYLSGRRTLADIVDPDKLAMTFTVDNISTLDGMLQPGDHVDVLWFYAGAGADGQAAGGRSRSRSVSLPGMEDGAEGAFGAVPGGIPDGPSLVDAGRRGGPLIFRAGPGEAESRLPKETVRFLEHDLKIIATGTRTVADDSAANINNDPAQRGQPVQFNTVTVALSPEQIQKLVMAKRVGELQLVLRSHDSKVITPAKVYTVRDVLGIRSRPGGPLYAADAIEYIVGGTSQNGQLTPRLDVRNLRRVAEGPLPGRRGGVPPQARLDSGGDQQRPVPLDQLLPTVNPSYPPALRP